MRFGLANNGARANSNCLACTPATMTSQPDGMYSSLTPRVWASLSPRSAAAPMYLPDFGSWPSHGQAIATPTRNVPSFLILSMVGLWPAAGTCCATAADAMRQVAETAATNDIKHLRFKLMLVLPS